jgi:hypothetical protein
VRKTTRVNWERYEEDFNKWADYHPGGKRPEPAELDFILSVIHPHATCKNYKLSSSVGALLALKAGAGVGYCQKSDGERKLFIMPELGVGIGAGLTFTGGANEYYIDWRTGKGEPKGLQLTGQTAIFVGGEATESTGKRTGHAIGLAFNLTVDTPPNLRKFSFLHVGNDFRDWRKRLNIKIHTFRELIKSIHEGPELNNFVKKNASEFQKPK